MARHLLAWLALIGTSGCALALDGPKPNRPKGYAPKCDENKGLVVADGLLATGVGIGALSAFGQDAPEAGVVLGLIAVAFAASAVRGNTVVNECRSEQALFAQENVPYIPSPDEPAGAYAGQRPVAGQPPVAGQRPVAPRAPVATAPVVTAPADPYVEPRVEAPPPTRPATSAPATIKQPVATKPAANEPAPAAIDPDAWRDFWTEVP